jgi:hypothetical protein
LVTWPGVDDVGSIALIVDVDMGRVDDEAVVDVALVDALSLVLTCPWSSSSPWSSPPPPSSSETSVVAPTSLNEGRSDLVSSTTAWRCDVAVVVDEVAVVIVSSW